MKARLMVAAAAFALLAGSASAHMMNTDQQDALRSHVTEASGAGGQIIPSRETESWEVGEVVPDEYESAPLNDVEGMENYSYVRDPNNIYVMNDHRKIVDKMPVTKASAAGGQETLGPNGKPESQPTQ